jgi:hypothetical protein
VVDAQGRLLGHLEAGSYTAGWHALTWSPRAEGRPLASGVYFLLATVGGNSSTARVVLLP